MALAVAMVTLSIGCGTATEAPSAAPPARSPSVSPAGPAVAPSEPERRAPIMPAPPIIMYPVAGAGTFAGASTDGPVAGVAGRLLRYRVLVEDGITGVSPDGFAQDVQAILGDPRGWTATGAWRLQRIAAQRPNPQFTVYLVTPATRQRLCGPYTRDRYTSCRNGDRVVINVARWAHGAPAFGADLAAYRQYVVNHETGHRLGRGHELCPGPGRPAPVMQQQTLGLHGCVANAWPVVDGRPYAGRSGQYDDPTPTDPTDPPPG